MHIRTVTVEPNFTSFVPLSLPGLEMRVLFYDAFSGGCSLLRLPYVGSGATEQPWAALDERATTLGKGFTHFWHLATDRLGPVIYAYNSGSGDLVNFRITDSDGVSTPDVIHNLGPGWSHVLQYALGSVPPNESYKPEMFAGVTNLSDAWRNLMSGRSYGVYPLGIADPVYSLYAGVGDWVCYNQSTGKSEVHHSDPTRYRQGDPEAAWIVQETFGLQPGLSSITVAGPFYADPSLNWPPFRMLVVHKEGRVWFLWPESPGSFGAGGTFVHGPIWWPREGRLPSSPYPKFDSIKGWETGWSDSWSATQSTNHDFSVKATERYTEFVAIQNDRILAYNPVDGQARVDAIHGLWAYSPVWTEEIISFQMAPTSLIRVTRFSYLFRYNAVDGRLDIDLGIS
jgi:hypothetical protein